VTVGGDLAANRAPRSAPLEDPGDQPAETPNRGLLPFRPMKRCTKCGDEKPPTEFRRDRSQKDGRYPQCKACERLWRQENAEYMADYHRRWQQANRGPRGSVGRSRLRRLLLYV
jgi:hypothetical protein